MQFFSNMRNSFGSSLKGLFLKVIYCTPCGSLQTLTAQTWQRRIGRFSLSLWKFLLYGPTLLQKSLSWESLSQRKYGTAVIWHVISFFFWILFMVYKTSNSTVALKQNRRRLKPYSCKCILQDFVRSADSGHFFDATWIRSSPMSSRTLLTFSDWLQVSVVVTQAQWPKEILLQEHGRWNLA